MAYTVELIGTEGAEESRTLNYAVHGAADDKVARALIDAVAPATYDNLYKADVHVVEEGDGYHTGQAQYGPHKQKKPGESEWSLDIGGGASQHISNSLETISKTAAAGAAPDFKGALNVRRDGNGRAVDGLDIDITTFTWSETHYFTYAAVTPTYLATVAAVRGKPNAAAFRMFAKGEVRLIRVSGAPKGEKYVALTFHFAASPNAVNIPVGDIVVPAKEGWQYLWAWYEDKEDAAAKELVKNPKAAYVERIYDYADYSLLNISDPWS